MNFKENIDVPRIFVQAKLKKVWEREIEIDIIKVLQYILNSNNLFFERPYLHDDFIVQLRFNEAHVFRSYLIYYNKLILL